MKKHISFYFSFSEIVEGNSEKEIIKKAEQLCINELGNNCFEYFDDRTIEKVEE